VSQKLSFVTVANKENSHSILFWDYLMFISKTVLLFHLKETLPWKEILSSLLSIIKEIFTMFFL